MTIFHITTQAQWQNALEQGFYTVNSLETEGFIHASTAEQVPRVFNAFYRDQENLVLLAIAPEKLESPVKWEAPVHPDGKNTDSITETEEFPHIYGKINLNAVTVVNLTGLDKVNNKTKDLCVHLSLIRGEAEEGGIS